MNVSRYRWLALAAAAAIVAVLALLWLFPSRPNGPWAELSVASVDVDHNGISITVDAEMPVENYVSLTCPHPVIAADQPVLMKGESLERRQYYYICKLPDEVSTQQRNGLKKGFTIRPGERILLSNQLREVVVFDDYLGNTHYQMKLALTDRPG